MTTIGRRHRARAVVDALGGIVLIVPTLVAAPLLRRAYNRWAERIVPDLQHLAVGELEPGRTLVLAAVDPATADG